MHHRICRKYIPLDVNGLRPALQDLFHIILVPEFPVSFFQRHFTVTAVLFQFRQLWQRHVIELRFRHPRQFS